MLLFGSRFLHSVESLKAFLFPQMRNTYSMVMALNSHFNHHRIEIKKILHKISFTLSLQMRSKLLLSSQQCIFRNKLQLNSPITVFWGR
ncbi:hypothetical protein ERO13_A07G149000v2 [Gossypium hirsutum]|uniref:Uncharacterized protein n=2 Tax=Gossypium TaxID=3633 RepID=A0A5D2YM66_GOSMU|nr:hypothetical protein ERO13_A07G149000v2 [Gossypium hirsutum]TYI19561.1 hypothetical protein ES332_A07G173100v1 [Gossypium tomentosum]TYJ27098.1 hypothetical protein E1A91_A07G163800v1 [Gossypium mustelinum]KAG4192303.1 hypothetical protein ERO13_A07G149000v2 [Gossypium hirsutum]KAG4192304.1 hypothetical protein ERO13_A07G149000v2 [Gossypium hirsutum]